MIHYSGQRQGLESGADLQSSLLLRVQHETFNLMNFLKENSCFFTKWRIQNLQVSHDPL
jgi:hypothetical protein